MNPRMEFIHLITSRLDNDNAAKALEAFDILSMHYNLVPAETALTTYNPTDEPVLLYYLESCKLDGKKKSTLRNKARHLRNFLSSVNAPIAQISTTQCRAYMAAVSERKNRRTGQPITAGTYNSIRSSISSFFEWCILENLAKINPMRTIRRKKEIREVKNSISEYELEQLRRAAKTEQERLMLEIMLGTGCRISELRLLKTDDFDFRNGKVLIYGVKTSEYRESITNGKMEAAYDAFMAVKKNGSPYLFASERFYKTHNAISTKAIEDMFQGICKRSGIKRRLKPHDTRRTFATYQAVSGTSVVEVQQLLGHKRLNTTQMYIDTAKLSFTEARKHIA